VQVSFSRQLLLVAE